MKNISKIKDYILLLIIKLLPKTIVRKLDEAVKMWNF